MGLFGRGYPHPTLLSSSNSFSWSIVVTYYDQMTNVAMRVMIYYIVCGDTNTV